MSASRIQHIKRITEALVAEVFQASLVSYLVLYVLEDFIPGFISKILDMNVILGIVVASGVLMIVLRPWEQPQHEHAKKSFEWGWKSLALIVALAIIGGCLVFWKLKDLGTISIPVSVLTAVIIFLVSFLLLTEEEREDTDRHK